MDTRWTDTIFCAHALTSSPTRPHLLRRCFPLRLCPPLTREVPNSLSPLHHYAIVGRNPTTPTRPQTTSPSSSPLPPPPPPLLRSPPPPTPRWRRPQFTILSPPSCCSWPKPNPKPPLLHLNLFLHLHPPPAKKAPIVVVGFANTDIYVKINRLPHEGEIITNCIGQTLTGRKGANQACCGDRLAHPTYFVDQIGDDAHSHLIEDALRACSVRLDCLSHIAGTPLVTPLGSTRVRWQGEGGCGSQQAVTT